MKSLRFVPLFFAALLPAWGDSITTSTSCSIGMSNNPLTTVTNVSSCSLSEPGNDSDVYADAMASGSSSLSGNAFSFDLSSSFTANADACGEQAEASAAASISASLGTAGPLRPGLLKIIPNNFFYFSAVDNGDTGAAASISFASAHASCVDSTFCVGPVPVEAVELGQSNLLTASANAGGDDLVCEGQAEGGATAEFTLQFFEADGATPVAVFVVTPEPRGFPFIVAALVWLLKRRIDIQRPLPID